LKLLRRIHISAFAELTFGKISRKCENVPRIPFILTDPVFAPGQWFPTGGPWPTGGPQAFFWWAIAHFGMFKFTE